MLAVLLEVPSSPEEWNRFAFHNQDQITLLQQAVAVQFGVTLTSYVLFPLNLDEPDLWLFNNQAAHNDINSVLGLQGHNVQDLEFDDSDAVAAWINLNYQELYDASNALRV